MFVSIPALVSIVCLAIALIVASMSAWELRRFLAETPSLASPDDMARFKRIVGRNMYQALLMLGVVAGGGIVVLVGLVLRWTTWTELFIVLGQAIVFSLLAMWLKSLESKVKSLRATQPELEAERDRIVKVWTSAMFPDW